MNHMSVIVSMRTEIMQHIGHMMNGVLNAKNLVKRYFCKIAV